MLAMDPAAALHKSEMTMLPSQLVSYFGKEFRQRWMLRILLATSTIVVLMQVVEMKCELLCILHGSWTICLAAYYIIKPKLPEGSKQSK